MLHIVYIQLAMEKDLPSVGALKQTVPPINQHLK